MKNRSYYLTLALLLLMLVLGAYLLVSGALEAGNSLRLPGGGSEAVLRLSPFGTNTAG